MTVTPEEQARRDLLAGVDLRECLEAGCRGDVLLLALAVRAAMRSASAERPTTWGAALEPYLSPRPRLPRSAALAARRIIDSDQPRFSWPHEQDPAWGSRPCDYPMVRRRRCGRPVGWQGGSHPVLVDGDVAWRAICRKHEREWGTRKVTSRGSDYWVMADETREAHRRARLLPPNTGGTLEVALRDYCRVPYREAAVPPGEQARERPPLRLVWDATRPPDPATV